MMTNEERYIAELEEQNRFFKAAYGIEEGSPQEIIHAATGVVALSTRCSPAEQEDIRRIMRHVIAQGSRAEASEARAKKLHDALGNVSHAVANALELAASPGQPRPPLWLLALGNNLDMVLADSALEKNG
jgi:hypothetical protein